MSTVETNQTLKNEPSDEADLNLQHLQAELARMDLLLRRQIKRWQSAGQDPGDAFRGLYVSDEEARALMTRPIGTNWGRMSPPKPEDEEAFSEAWRGLNLQAKAFRNAARSQGHPTRLDQLAEDFSLDGFELDTLLICLAPHLDTRYEKIYGYLQDDVTKKRPTVNLVLDLLCTPGPSRLASLSRFSRGGPLFRHRILRLVPESDGVNNPLLSRALTVDETIAAWLLGEYVPGKAFGDHANLSHPKTDPDETVIDEEVHSHLQQAVGTNVGTNVGTKPILAFYGSDLGAQEAAADLFASEAKQPLLTVDLSGATEGELTKQRFLELALRDARLTDAIPFLKGWEILFNEGAPPASTLEQLLNHPNTVIVASQFRWLPKGVPRDRQLHWLEFPIPSYPQRLALWRYFLEDTACEETLDLNPLAGQFQMTTGDIRDAVATAGDIAAKRGVPISIEDLFEAARSHSNPGLDRMAHKITPRYGWEDIVLPEDQLAQLREILATMRGRPQVLDAWGVGKKLASSRGVTALFAGPPGTGKTMAAEIIAGDLGMDLYKIDLSSIVSKYIGETEKNLERIFKEATTSNAILFFDEADALFGKRSEVRDSHDRYANIEISYLLQRMETYDGMTILATNLRANLDEAFTRRLQFAVDFPFPEEADRLRIWQTLFPPEVPRESSLDFEALAGRFKLAGGNIRNVLVSAAYLASADGGKVTMAQLLHGTRRELLKMGRLITESDLEK